MVKGNKQKVQKNIEIVSQIASMIEEMAEGERLRITPFAKSIEMSNGSHPHVETVKNKLMEAFLWQQVTQKVKFIKKGEKIIEIEKIEPDEESIYFKKEVRNDILGMKESLEELLSRIPKKVKK